MPTTFEQLPFVYQIETIVHAEWLAAYGIQSPYTSQTLAESLKQESMKIWLSQGYNQEEILKQLTPENEQRSAVVIILERLLRYKNTSQFGDGMDERYRWDAKKLMNDIYQRQLDKTEKLEQQIQNLNEFSTLISPSQPYNFNQLKEEIIRLKVQDLTIQIPLKKQELEQLTSDSKSKLDEDLQGYLEILLYTKEKSIGGIAKANLLKKIEETELELLLAKQKKINELEEYLISLQQNQEAKIEISPK